MWRTGVQTALTQLIRPQCILVGISSCGLLHWSLLHRFALPSWIHLRSVTAVCFFLSLFAVYEEPEDPSNRSFFSEIISSVSDVKFSHSGRYMLTRDYLTVKVWDLNMETKPIETYQVKEPTCENTISDVIRFFPSLVQKVYACINTGNSPVTLWSSRTNV